MIQQHDLGKKIADLRKAKGLTQEELVAKCNLNVRTLQRIEAGLVVPRIHTIRLIFKALDFPFEESLNDKGLIKKWLEQFYISFIDLFNLKTNTIKKISILAVITTSIILAFFAVNEGLSTQDYDTKRINKDFFENDSESQLPFFDFSCYGCIEKKGLVIGRDISFSLAGVKVKNVRLMIIDKKTREFDAIFVEGRFLERKVIIEYPKEYLIDRGLKYSADNIDKSKSKIILKGNAKVYYRNDKANLNDYESIETDEVVINLR